MKKINLEEFTNFFNENELWKKLKKQGSKAGINVVYAVLLLYYALLSDDVPYKAKMTIIGAIGYFIFPFDLVADFIPFTGYTDDLAALMMAVAQVAYHISPDIRFKAKDKLGEWFGHYDDADLADIDEKINADK